MVNFAHYIDFSALFVLFLGKEVKHMSVSNSKYIINNDITFKCAKGVSDKTGKEFHTHHEIIYFMGGKAKFISENIQTVLKPNTLIVIPCETYHQLLITGSQEDYHRCVFHFLHIKDLEELIDQSINGVTLIAMNQRFQYLFNQMIALTETPRSESVTSVIMQSVLSLVLNEIALNGQPNVETTIPDTISEKCIAYISKHITEDISIEGIAKELNVSVSYLAHSFKSQMNISIHQYILKKRLVMAHHRILEGEPATKAAMECGFNDYSGFYKQFKKMFNKSPSSKEREVF